MKQIANVAALPGIVGVRLIININLKFIQFFKPGAVDTTVALVVLKTS